MAPPHPGLSPRGEGENGDHAERSFFYLFAAILVGSAFMVIAVKNPVHAVLFLILAFFNAAGLFVLLGAEFLAMILVVVYVGAVMVLFLFVVMMLDVDFAELQSRLPQISARGRHRRRPAPRRADLHPRRLGDGAGYRLAIAVAAGRRR